MAIVLSIPDTVNHVSNSVLQISIHTGIVVVDHLLHSGLLLRSFVLLNIRSLSAAVGKTLAQACKLLGYRALGTIEQQVITTSTSFSSAPIFRYRATAPAHSDYPPEETSIDSLTLSAICNGKPLEREICSVCLEFFERCDRCFMAPCRHVFHTHCILHWIHISREFSCPVCRLDMYCPDREAYYAAKMYTTMVDLYDVLFTYEFLPVGKMLQLPNSTKPNKG
ncbi:uncharacterized protein LOC129590431 [Paramacrobiotus metropolitanus]|uniref:uncharacterized protein LOC129590431 n=1 Tax=Paramacrobiotus metropolitanus TaxID=2943436 RepID=UPI002445CF50|nr:uncharacterized protein LOC129590431 [Paramacrobiotus metropolitanus]